MEKKTLIPNVFEIDCPVEKKQIRLGKYITLYYKYLVNKETGVQSCKFCSCKWDKFSIVSKTVVLTLPAYYIGSDLYTPHILWNYETGSTFEIYGEGDFAEITIESDEGNYRSFRTKHDSIITVDMVTGQSIEPLYIKVSQTESDKAYAYVNKDGTIVWKLKLKKENKTTTYHKVNKVTLNSVDLWMVQHSKNDAWHLLYEGKEIASSKTGSFKKIGRYVFGQIEGNKYELYNIFKDEKYEHDVELAEKSFNIPAEGQEIPLKKAYYYSEPIIGFTSNGKWFVNEHKKAYPILSPEDKYEAPKVIGLGVKDEDFHPKRSFRDWARRYFPVNSVHKFTVTKVKPLENGNLQILQDQETGAEIIIVTKDKISEEGCTIYLSVAKNVEVRNFFTEKKSKVLANKAVVSLDNFYLTTKEDYETFRKAINTDSQDNSSDNVPTSGKTIIDQPSPSEIPTSVISDLQTLAKYLLSNVEGEITLSIIKDAEGNVNVEY